MVKYQVMYGDSWAGIRNYWFMHEGEILFKGGNFHSDDHAKREAVEHLAVRGIHVTVEEIGLKWDGCM